MSNGGWGVDVVGGIQFVTDVVMLPDSPADDEAGIVGDLSFVMRVFQGDDWCMTWSCHLGWEVGLIGGLPFMPGIAKSRPGKSDPGGGGVLSANFFEIFLESAMFSLGTGILSHATCLVVAVNKAFGMDVPTGAHEGGVVPLGAIHQAFPCKIVIPVLAFLHQKFGDGGSIFGDALPFGFVRFPFLPLPFLLAAIPWRGVELGQWIFGRGVDKIGGKNHVE
jgi:hypothetical protein